MELNEFQNTINKLAEYPRELGPYYTILNVQKNVGLLCEKLMANLENAQPKFSQQDIMKISISMGDIIKTVLCMAADLGLSFSEVAALAIKKSTMEYDKRLNEKMNIKVNK